MNPVLPDAQPQAFDIENRIDLVERAGLPGIDLIDDHVGDIGDQLPRQPAIADAAGQRCRVDRCSRETEGGSYVVLGLSKQIKD